MPKRRWRNTGSCRPPTPGAEAAVRFAQLLKTQGHIEESRTVAKELLEQARIAPPHYRKAQRDWLGQRPTSGARPLDARAVHAGALANPDRSQQQH